MTMADEIRLIRQRELTALTALIVRAKRADELEAEANRLAGKPHYLECVAQGLIDDVRQRYPGEPLRCPHMIALAEALEG